MLCSFVLKEEEGLRVAIVLFKRGFFCMSILESRRCAKSYLLNGIGKIFYFLRFWWMRVRWNTNTDTRGWAVLHDFLVSFSVPAPISLFRIWHLALVLVEKRRIVDCVELRYVLGTAFEL